MGDDPASETPAGSKPKTPLPSEAAMQTKAAQTVRWPWGVWSTLGLTLLIFILPQLIIGLLLTEDLLERLDNGSDVVLNFGVLVVGELITFGLLVAILRSKGQKLQSLALRAPSNLAYFFMALPAYGLYFLATIASFVIAEQFLGSEQLEQDQQIGFEAAASTPELVMVFIGLVLIVPFIEEVLFRGFLFRGFASRMGWFPAALLSSALFGLAHLQLNVAIDTFILGMAAAMLVHYSSNLWPSIVLHAIKNSVAFLVLFGSFD